MDHPQVRIVESFEDLCSTAFSGEVNALCWPRVLQGDYAEILHAVPESEGVTTLEVEWLERLDLSEHGHLARQQLLEDLQRLSQRGLDPMLDVIHACPEDAYHQVVATDVHSWHVDSAPVLADTYLCTYIGACSEAVANAEVLQKILKPEIRQALLEEYGGDEDEDFKLYLSDNCYDLHYELLPHAQPYAFGVGYLWRIAIQCPDSPVQPCVHRAPRTLPGDPPRLLLIS